MIRPPTTTELRKFDRACKLLDELTEAGWGLYVDETGNLNLMKGPSHDDSPQARPLQGNSVASNHIRGLSGGAW